MSYQVLARKYRPKNFDTLVGQEHVVRALSHALESGRLHHAYLFTGTRGVGKTTLSRILAKSFNCLGADGQGGVTSQPCGVCNACMSIDSGRFVDYIEMDAASNRGVDEMSQLLEQAVYAPSNARFKVYMIDEVHMLTNTAFNSMLKTLEEPPSHVKFILATTDPQKIPVTVLSRCLQFNLKQMPPGHIISHLENILGQEAIPFELPALRLLAQGAHGSMRDALSLTDQAIAYAAGTVTLDAVQGMLGALDQSFLVAILDALAAEDGSALLALTDQMTSLSLSFHTALQDLAALLHRIALAQTVPAGLPADWPEREEILRLATVFDAQEVQLFYQIVLHGKQELGLAPDEYAGFSMTLLRMLAFRPNGLGQQSGARPAAQSSAAAPAPVRGMSPAKAALQAARATTPAAPPASVASSAPDPRGAVPPRFAQDDAESGTAQKKTEFESGQGQRVSAISNNIGNVSKTRQDSANTALRVTEQIVAKAAARAAAAVSEVASGGASEVVSEVASEMPTLADGLPSRPESTPTSRPTSAPTSEGAMPALVLHPIQDWDGDWPALAAQLPLRGVVQQFVTQTELLGVQQDGGSLEFHLRCALETLCSSANIEKLSAALEQQFGLTVRIKTEIGQVWHCAFQRAEAARVVRQRAAEALIRNDPFVQSMQREFGATLVPDSIRPLAA